MENIELLENELNQLGSSWNLFGKVDTMKYLLKKIKEEYKQLNKQKLSSPTCTKRIKNRNTGQKRKL